MGETAALVLSAAFFFLAAPGPAPEPPRHYPAPRQAEAPVPIQRVPIASYREPPPETIRCTANGCEVAK